MNYACGNRERRSFRPVEQNRASVQAERHRQPQDIEAFLLDGLVAGRWRNTRSGFPSIKGPTRKGPRRPEKVEVYWNIRLQKGPVLSR